ncbi:sugar transferase [Defluviitalea phaphyphila]|uniref:sugar transferase n=1 Tax=Defluviitalea phaphyphila TaxID=1473580 RepID=UPI0007318B7B|nr:sugar transferase [Defluviitalea phaphyphila]
MNQKKTKFIKEIMAIIDIIFTILSFFIAYWIRDYFFVELYGRLQGINHYIWVLWVIVPTWPILLSVFKVYDLYKDGKVYNNINILFKLVPAVIIGELVLASTFYFMGDNSISRLFYGIFGIVNLFILWLDKIFIKLFWKSIFIRKTYHEKVIVVGTEDRAEQFGKYIETRPDLMIDIIGYVQVEDNKNNKKINDDKILGKIENLIDIIKENVVDEVVFALPRDYIGNIEEYILDCESMGITVHMVMDLYDLKIAKTTVETIGTFPVLTFYTVGFTPIELALKRIIDILGAIVGLIITGMVSIFIIPAIKLESPGPAFFSQYRVGRNGRKFKFYKFRSMYQDAEERKKELMKYNEMKGHMFKMKDDPRITKVGKFLRSTSLDELPQFWNVLKGDMSLVGTRPPTVDEVKNYEIYHRRRISIKPGLTGMWQASGRSDINDFEEVVKLDVEYIDNWSILLDIKILFMTVFSVLKRKGSR